MMPRLCLKCSLVGSVMQDAIVLTVGSCSAGQQSRGSGTLEDRLLLSFSVSILSL